MESSLGRLGLEFEFFRGVDAGLREHESVSRYDPTAALRDHLEPLTIGEIGCFASHYLVWHLFAQASEPVVVMEVQRILHSSFWLTAGPNLMAYLSIMYQPRVCLIRNEARWYDGASCTKTSSIKDIGIGSITRGTSRVWVSSLSR
jgi:hypothetical protein